MEHSLNAGSPPDFIKCELAAFTGLSLESVQEYLDRKTYPSHKGEFLFWHPTGNEDLRWFYASSRSYLFSNAIHILPPMIAREIEFGKRVLDFGGGSGNFSFTLAGSNWGCYVTYFDVSIIQCQFVRYVSAKHNLGIKVIEGDAMNGWSLPRAPCRILERDQMDYILALDVLEHIPDYPDAIARMAPWLKCGGIMYIRAPFGSIGDPTHLKDRHNLHEVMAKSDMEFIRTVEGIQIWSRVARS